MRTFAFLIRVSEPCSKLFLSLTQKTFSFLCLLPVLFAVGSVYADTNYAQRHDVQAFINTMVKKHHQLKKRDLIKIFSAVKIRLQVITHVNKPYEKRPWHIYQMLFVSDWRIKHGVEFWNKHEKTLNQAEKIYGVPASIIVATLGVETKYGMRTGDFRVIDSLSNLAFSDSPRAPFFKSELEHFLLLTHEQHLNPLKIKGSYAGAIGQPQFMPSSYRNYAVNFSKSGKIDLMHNEIDIIGSIANYYKKNGWLTNEPVATKAMIIGNRYDYLLRKNKISSSMTIGELTRFGIVPRKSIIKDELLVKVIELESLYSKEYWLGFHNFDVIRRYNPSDLYAMAVYQLSNYIQELRERSHHG